ncbi:MAG: hypothetical protein ETSY2_38260 [Candidatus Entotheonella gemina]|uniref:Uncharacterized protein n=1 Tax=Candidatus Entotheonella gemina TaxID=1429439 RepID=W4LT37_9BACT|nr:MAG: hypothetical protein ETSY2_38260 [Candidatus Entotheonella gemina]
MPVVRALAFRLWGMGTSGYYKDGEMASHPSGELLTYLLCLQDDTLKVNIYPAPPIPQPGTFQC